MQVVVESDGPSTAYQEDSTIQGDHPSLVTAWPQIHLSRTGNHSISSAFSGNTEETLWTHRRLLQDKRRAESSAVNGQQTSVFMCQYRNINTRRL